MPSCNVVAGVRVAGVEKLRRRVLIFSLPLLLASSVFLSLGGGGEGEIPWVARVLAPGPWGFYRRGARGRGGLDAGERRGCDGLTGRTRGGIRAPQPLSCARGKGETRAARNRPTAGADAGVSRAGGRRETRSARCRRVEAVAREQVESAGRAAASAKSREASGGMGKRYRTR